MISFIKLAIFRSGSVKLWEVSPERSVKEIAKIRSGSEYAPSHSSAAILLPRVTCFRINPCKLYCIYLMYIDFQQMYSRLLPSHKRNMYLLTCCPEANFVNFFHLVSDSIVERGMIVGWKPVKVLMYMNLQVYILDFWS